MTLEVGKTYKLRGGQTAKVLALHKGVFYGARMWNYGSHDLPEMWDPNGRCLLSNSGENGDIVAELKEPALWSSPEDVPVGAVIREKGKPYLFVIIQADNRGIMVAGSFVDYARMADYEWRWPQETTWRPCVKGGGK